MKRDSILLSALGGATALGLGYLLYSKNQMKSKSSMRQESTHHAFQIIQSSSEDI